MPVHGGRTSVRSVVTFHGGYAVAETPARKLWATPSIRRYGTFETATQYCDKKWGLTDGFTMQGAPITCAS